MPISWSTHWASSRSSVKSLMNNSVRAEARRGVSYNEPAHHQPIGNHRGGVAHYTEEAVDVLSLPALPCTVGGIGWCWVIVTGSERVQLLQEPIVWVDLRSSYSARAGSRVRPGTRSGCRRTYYPSDTQWPWLRTASGFSSLRGGEGTETER